MNWSLILYNAAYMIGRRRPVFLESVVVVVLVRRTANTAKHLLLARAGQGILRN